MLQPVAEKQYWHRKVGSDTYKQWQKIVVMDEAGRTSADIAKKLGLKDAGSINNIRWLAKKNGWYDASGEPVDMEFELAREIDGKIVRNVSAILDGQMTNWQTHEMTLAAAKGRGMFKNHDKVEGMANAPSVVAIQVVMPPISAGQQQMEIPDGMVGGLPAYIEGEVSGQPALGTGTGTDTGE